MRGPIALALLGFLLCMCGCKGHSLEGTWVAADSAKETFTFSGRNFKLEGKLPKAVTMTVTGTYTLENNFLNLKSDAITMTSPNPADQKELDKDVQQNRDRYLKGFDAKNPREVSWWQNGQNEQVDFRTSDGKDTMYEKVKS